MSVFAKALARIDARAGRRSAQVILLLLVGGIYTWAYARHPLNPGFTAVDERVGWWSWSDQFKYLKATEAMADGAVSRDVYHYPLGYSALGVPFVRCLPAHPYFVPNLLLVLVTALLWWRLARRWVPATVALVVAGGFIVTHGDLLRLTMVVPWNTLPTQVTLLAGMLALLELKDRRAVWCLAALTAITWWVRPGDALCFAPMLAWAVVRLPRWGDRIVCASSALAIIGLAVVAMGVLNISVWDSWRTPYEQAAHTMVGFFSYPMAQKLFWAFIDARPFFGETSTALLWRYPWLFLAIPGVVFWLKREGAAGAAVLATLGLNWLLYLGYNDFFPSSFYRFSLIHYVSWSFLPLLAGVAAACWAGWSIRAVWLGWLAAVIVFVTACSLQLTEEKLSVQARAGQVSVLPVERPLWVRFPGESLDKVAALRLDGRMMLEAADYQIPYVPSDLKLLLSNRAIGTKLDATPDAGIVVVPQTGKYQWGWRWDWSRPSGISF